MTADEVKALAERVLRPILGPVGFVSADGEARPNHDDEDSFFVTAHFAPGSEVTTGRNAVTRPTTMPLENL